MPILGRNKPLLDEEPIEPWNPTELPRSSSSLAGHARKGSALFPICGNPDCSTSRIHLWRSRQVPIFEGEWTCSEQCTHDRIRAALVRELDGRTRTAERHRHRMPLGLVMLSEGWITQDQLRSALDAQKAAGSGRLGDWLVRQHNIPEHLVTRALSVQWSCPVFTVENHSSDSVSPLIPRLLLDAFGILPLRVAGNSVLYVAFEDRIDPCVTFALERMTGLRVEGGLVDSSEFHRLHSRILNAVFPSVRILEAADDEVLARVLSKFIEKEKPVEARLVRIHECLWLRIWRRVSTHPVPLRNEVMDLLCPLSKTN